MATIRNQVISGFCTKIGAVRALRYVDGADLPMRSVWDSDENAEKNKYGKHEASVQVQVQVIEDSSGKLIESGGTYETEGDLLDALLGQIQTDAMTLATASDQAFFDLINGIEYTGCQYGYSEDGSSIVGLSAGFLIKYKFSNTNPSSKGD